MTTERFSRYIESTCKHLSIRKIPEKKSESNILFTAPINSWNPMYSTPLYYEYLTDTYYLPLTTDPRNPKPVLPELLVHYLLLYNLSMISRYETDWWYDLLGSYNSEDYPFIYQFLNISAQKSLIIFQHFYYQNLIYFMGNKNTSQMTRVLSLATSYSHRDKVPTTIGARELNFRVRYGNGCDLSAIITKL